MKYLFLIAVLFLSFLSFSQTIITGTVTDESGEPLIVNMLMQEADSITIVGFSSTNIDGMYSLKYNGSADSLLITATGIMVGKHAKKIANQSQTLNFQIEASNLELEEVIIKPPKIRMYGDTINYSVSAYLDQNDRVIADVLRKLPGIDVTPSGEILYNGRGINRFYVENMDLLKGRYGLATNNISARDVSTVEVLENHQPIKALQDRSYSDNAAINLKLKESAKGTIALSGAVGLGYKPVMWNAEATAMYFAANKQNITTYKTNNHGEDSGREFRSHYDNERITIGTGSLLSVQSPGTPPVAAKRYMNNNSHAASFNHLTKLKKDIELTTNIIYFNDRQEKKGYSYREEYLTDNNTLTIEEDLLAINKIHATEIRLVLNANQPNYYLNNSLNLRGSWNYDHGDGITRSNAGNLDETISQRLKKPSLGIDNSLNYIKNVKNNSYETFFSVGYGHNPHVLTVTPANFMDASYTSLTQDVLSEDLASSFRFVSTFKRNKFIMDYGIWGRLDIRSLDSELRAKDDEGNSILLGDEMRNDLRYNNYQAGINQSYSYEHRKFRIGANLPVSYYLLTIDDRIPDNYVRENKVIFNPSLSLSYKINSFSLSASGGMSRSFGNMNSAYSGYIMHSYRSLLRNTVDNKLFESRSENVGLSFSFRNIFSVLFLSANVNYNHSWRNLLYGYNYQGIMSIKTTIDQPTEAESYSASIEGSKGLDFWSATVRVNAGYSIRRGELLIQDEILHSRSQNYRVDGGFNLRPTGLMGLNYSLAWNRSRSYTIERSERFDPIKSISQNAQFIFFLAKTLTLNLEMEHQYNSALTDPNNFFADIVVKLKYKRIDWELGVNNLFNTKKYISAHYNDISMAYSSYDLRPFNILLKARFNLNQHKKK